MHRLLSRSSSQLTCLVMLLFSVILSATAHEMEAKMNAFDVMLFARLEGEGQIHVDSALPPSHPTYRLLAREATSGSNPTSTMPTPSKSGHSSSVSATPSLAASALSAANNMTTPATSAVTSSTATQSTPTSLPTPFDTSLGNNFTAQSCPTFFNNFINNATFQSCLPVSLLLQNSNAFFKATRFAKFLDSVLDTACSASLAICSPMMSSLAADLISDNNCGADYGRQNPIVTQAYAGLMAYEPLYNATCLENPTTGNYCFVDAVSNNTNAADLYPYYTALGIALPSTAIPTCNTCLQQTMSIFAGYAQLKDQPLAKTYMSCATQIDSTCGASFADTSVKVAVQSKKSSAAQVGGRAMVMSTAAAMLTWLIIL